VILGILSLCSACDFLPGLLGMNSKVEYSGLPSDDGSRTLSIDGDSERYERESFLDEKFEKPLARRSWGDVVMITIPWMLVAVLSIAFFHSYLSPKRVCAEDGMEKYCKFKKTNRWDLN
jgi:hypothetical protein